MFKQLLKDSALYGLSDFLFKILAFFTFPIFAHLLSVNDYGIMSFAAVIAGFIGMFLNLGLTNAIQRFYFDNDFDERNRPSLVSTGYMVMAAWSSLLTLGGIGVAYFFRDYTFHKYGLPFSYLAVALLTNIPAMLLGYSNDTIRLHFKPVNFFLMALCRNLAGIVLAIILMKYYHMGLWGYFIANLIGGVIFVPLGIYLTRKDCKLLFDKALAKTIVLYGYPFIFAGLAYWLFGSMDRWMLSEMSSMEQAGLYSIAFKVGSVVLFVNTAFGQAWSPVAIKLVTENPLTYKSMFSKLFTYWFTFLLIIGTVAVFFSMEFFRFTTPPAYWEAVNISVWSTIGLVISGTTQLTAIGISISKKTKYFTYISWISAVVNFALNLLLIPKLGALGSAVATSITYLALSGGYLYISQRVHYMPLEKLKLILLLFLLLLTGFVAVFFNSLVWSMNIVFMKLGWLLIMIFTFVRLKIIDLEAIKNIFFNKGNKFENNNL